MSTLHTHLLPLGFLGLVGTMTWRGIYQVNGLDFVGLSHVAGLTHAFLGLGLLFFSLNLKKAITDAN